MSYFKSDFNFSARFSVAMAPGMVPDSYGPYEPGHYVASNAPETGWRKELEPLYCFHAFGFGALLSGAFALHVDAQQHARDLKNKLDMPLDYSGMDIGSIKRHAFEARMFTIDVAEVMFTPQEDAIIPLLGAIDTLSYGEKNSVVHAFPSLKGLAINEPPAMPYDTIDGNPPAWREVAYITLSDDQVAALEAAADKGEMDKITAFQKNYPGSYYRCDLSGVAEEVGKARLDGKELKRIFKIRAYSYEETIEPVTPPGQADIIRDVLSMLDQKPAPIRDAILSGIRQPRVLVPA